MPLLLLSEGGGVLCVSTGPSGPDRRLRVVSYTEEVCHWMSDSGREAKGDVRRTVGESPI